jgi:carboxylesterase type B
MGHGASIMHHLMMPSPYFRSAIVQSPAFIPSPNQARLDQTYNQLLTLMGAKNLDELLEANTTDLMQANADMIFSKFLCTKCI